MLKSIYMYTCSRYKPIPAISHFRLYPMCFHYVPNYVNTASKLPGQGLDGSKHPVTADKMGQARVSQSVSKQTHRPLQTHIRIDAQVANHSHQSHANIRAHAHNRRTRARTHTRVHTHSRQMHTHEISRITVTQNTHTHAHARTHAHMHTTVRTHITSYKDTCTHSIGMHITHGHIHIIVREKPCQNTWNHVLRH